MFLMNGMNNRNINFKNIDLIEIVWQIFCKVIKIFISRLLNNLIFDNYRKIFDNYRKIVVVFKKNRCIYVLLRYFYYECLLYIIV